MALQNKDSVFQNMSSGFPYQQQQYQQAPPPYNPPSRYGMPQQGMGGMPQQGMGMHQQGMGGMPQQGMGMQQQGMGGMPQQGMGMHQQGMGMMSMPQGGDNGPQNPLEKKVMVLYIIPGDQISMQAYQMVVDYPEILVQDARAINPRPTWLTRVPTVVMVTNKMVYDGAQAF